MSKTNIHSASDCIISRTLALGTGIPPAAVAAPVAAHIVQPLTTAISPTIPDNEKNKGTATIITLRLAMRAH